MSCTHLNDLLATEIPCIQEHLANHKWYRHIQDDEEAMSSFIQEYGEYMKRVYCSTLCPVSCSCDIDSKYKQEPHDNEPLNLTLRKFYNLYISK